MLFFAIEQFDRESKEWTRLEMSSDRHHLTRRAKAYVSDKLGGFGLRIRCARVRDKQVFIVGKVLWEWVPEALPSK